MVTLNMRRAERERIRLEAVFCEGAAAPGLQLRLPAPTATVGLRLGSDQEIHPVLGPIDLIGTGDCDPLTAVGRIDWTAPASIPPVLEPARLPPGSGTGLLNVLAERAAGPLRYRGPYPTASLFESLSTCFRPSATVEAFTEGVEDAAVAGWVLEPDVWFTPAPFVRYRSGAVVVEVRGEIVEAIYVEGARFERGARIGRKVEIAGRDAVAVLDVPGNPPLELLRASSSGHVITAVATVAPLAGSHLGKPLPEPVSRTIVATAMAAAPSLLRPAIESIASRPIVWGDTGLALAAIAGDRVAVHGAMATGDLDPTDLLAALVEAAAPMVARLAQRELSP